MKTPLHYASEAGHAPVVQLLMEYGADPFETDNCGRNALHYAIYSGQTEIIETLIQISIEVIHEKDHAGRTPLHHAVFMESNQILMIQKLMEYGSDVNALDNDKRTALHHAAEGNKARVIPILIQGGALTGLRDKLMKKTPIELAANDHIRQLILALIAPPSLEEEDTEKQVSSIFRDTKVSKRGHIYHQTEYDPPLEPPIEQPIETVIPFQEDISDA